MYDHAISKKIIFHFVVQPRLNDFQCRKCTLSMLKLEELEATEEIYQSNEKLYDAPWK
jgi:hypothetical protein